ncbi:MAG: ribonuclease HI family protein [Phycisphaerae bacterium]
MDVHKDLRVRLEVDGGSRGNPGPAGAGVVVRDAADGQVLQEFGVFLGKATNNVAEYRGLLAGLQRAADLGAREVEVFSDSELLVRQMNGQYRVRNEGLVGLFEQARQLANGFAKCSFNHVRREQNTAADRLANQAMNLKRDVDEATEA